MHFLILFYAILHFFLYNCGLFVVISFFLFCHQGFFLVHTVYCLCTELLWTPFFCGQFFSCRSKHSNTVKMTVSIFTNTNLTMIHTDQDTNLLILFYVICIFFTRFSVFCGYFKISDSEHFCYYFFFYLIPFNKSAHIFVHTILL